MLRLQARKVILVLLVLFIGCGLAVPNLFSPETRKAIETNAPSWIPRAFLPIHAVVLGLDLQGGSHVLLEIDRAELVRSQVTQLRDDVRRILREERVSIQGGIQTTTRGVQMRVADAAERARRIAIDERLEQTGVARLVHGGGDHRYRSGRNHRAIAISVGPLLDQQLPGDLRQIQRRHRISRSVQEARNTGSQSLRHDEGAGSWSGVADERNDAAA